MKIRLALGFLVSLAFLSAPVHAEDGLEPPVPIRTVAPKYPDSLRREGTSGVVQVSVLIDESGNVADTKVEKSTNEAFVEPALDALRKWKFKPAKRAGEVVSLRVSVPIRFLASN